MGGQCIGLLSNESGNLYLAELLNSFFEAAENRRFRGVVLLGRTWQSPIDNESLYNQMYRFLPFLGLQGQVVASALLSTYHSLQDLPAYAQLTDSQTVYLGGALEPTQFSVELEASAAIRAAVRHLALQHGCARVACVTGPVFNPETVLRLRAYRKAVRELEQDWVTDWEECGDFTVAGGERAIQALMERLPGIEGVFFMSDAMALGALRYFEKARIPGHRRPRIISFDDIEELQYLNIPLSTIAQPLDLLMEECIRRLAGEPLPLHADVQAELVLRRSCGCSGGEERTSLRSAFHDGLDLLFSLQKLRMAAQALFHNLDPTQWDQRMLLALQRMEMPWAGVLEWRGPIPLDWGQVSFERWVEYDSVSQKICAQQPKASVSVLPQVIASRSESLIFTPLVCGAHFLGVLVFAHVHGMEQTYDSLATQIAAAMMASCQGGTCANTP